MKEKYLPIGTVVRLKDGQKNLMIVGFSVAANDNSTAVFDYMGCLHPEGVMSSDMNFLFNHNQIAEVMFEGYINDEEVTFKRRLNEFMTSGTIDGIVPNLNGDFGGVPNLNGDFKMVNGSNENEIANNVQPQMFNGVNQ